MRGDRNGIENNNAIDCKNNGLDNCPNSCISNCIRNCDTIFNNRTIVLNLEMKQKWK